MKKSIFIFIGIIISSFIGTTIIHKDTSLPKITSSSISYLEDKTIISVEVTDDSGNATASIYYYQQEYDMNLTSSNGPISRYTLSFDNDVNLDKMRVIVKDLNNNSLVKKVSELQ